MNDTAPPSTGPRRGRVLACDGGAALVRVDAEDVWVTADGAARPGDFVEIRGDRAVPVVRAGTGGEYPTPISEVVRLGPRRRANLQARGIAMAALRAFFAERQFIEVETPLRVPAPGLEVHLQAVPAGTEAWLITSPEFQMKRLLTAGFERIYTVCKCFRAGEHGRHHSSEFTMLEWYRAWSGWEQIAADTEALVARVAQAVRGTTIIEVDDGGPGGRRTVDVAPPWPRMTVAEAMQRFAGIDLADAADAAELAARVTAAGIDVGDAQAWDDVFYSAFLARIEPALGAWERPVVLSDWPVQLAALARRKPDAPHLVERFEVYIAGIELCNAFGELVDPVEQRARFASDLASRKARGLPSYPVDDKFLAALEEGLPPCAGIALGVDRLMMLVTGAGDIGEVLTFTADEL